MLKNTFLLISAAVLGIHAAWAHDTERMRAEHALWACEHKYWAVEHTLWQRDHVRVEAAIAKLKALMQAHEKQIAEHQAAIDRHEADIGRHEAILAGGVDQAEMARRHQENAEMHDAFRRHHQEMAKLHAAVMDIVARIEALPTAP